MIAESVSNVKSSHECSPELTHTTARTTHVNNSHTDITHLHDDTCVTTTTNIHTITHTHGHIHAHRKWKNVIKYVYFLCVNGGFQKTNCISGGAYRIHSSITHLLSLYINKSTN